MTNRHDQCICRITSALSSPINVPDALSLIEGIFRDAIESAKHQPGDWRELGPVGNLSRLRDHFMSYNITLGGDDHLANLVCRGLMLLQLREEAKR